MGDFDRDAAISDEYSEALKYAVDCQEDDSLWPEEKLAIKRLAVALRESMEIFKFILYECDWEGDKRIGDVCRRFIEKYREVNNE